MMKSREKTDRDPSSGTGKTWNDGVEEPPQGGPGCVRQQKTQPYGLDALRTLVRVHEKAGSWPDLAEALRRLIHVGGSELEPEELRACYAKLGELYGGPLERPDDAIESWEKVLDVKVQDPEAMEALDQLFGADARWEELVDLHLNRLGELTALEDRLSLYYRMARLYEEKLQSPEKALIILQAAFMEDYSNEGTANELERLAREANQWNELLTSCNEQLQSVGEQADKISLALRLGRWYAQLNRPEFAANCFNQVLTWKPEHQDALDGLADVYRNQSDWDHLAQVLTHQAEVGHDDDVRIRAWLALGELYEDRLRDNESALRAFDAALAIDDSLDEALNALERHYRNAAAWSDLLPVLQRKLDKENDPDQVVELQHQLVEICEMCLEQEPHPSQRVELYHRLGCLRGDQLGDSTGAIREYRRALNIDSGHGPSLEQLRRIYSQRQDWQAAAEVLEHSLEHAKMRRQRSALLCQLAQVHDQHLADHPRAVECYELALEQDGENLDAAKPLALEYVATERWEEAETLLEMLVRKAPMYSPEPDELQRVYVLLGEAASRQDKDDKALKAYEAASELDENHLPTLRCVAALHYKRQDWDKAFHFYQLILVTHPKALSREEVVEHFYQLGMIKLRVGERNSALKYFASALEKDVHHRPTLESLVGIHEKQGNWEQVIHFKQAMIFGAVAEERFDILVELGDIWQAKLNDSRRAIKFYSEALKIEPTNRDLLHKIMDLYTTTERWERAVRIMETIVSLEEENLRIAKYQYSIAVVYRDKLMDPKNAVRHFNLALDKDPDNLKAFEAVDRILTQRKDWSALEKCYRKMLYRLKDRGKTKLEVTLWHFLGEIYRSRLGRPAEAANAFQMASRLEPDNMERHTILAELYTSIPDQWKQAVAKHRFLLTQDPTRFESYKELRLLYTKAHRYDKAWCLCATLVFLGKADDEERNFYEQYRTDGIVRAQLRLDNELWIKQLFHPDEDLYIGKIFATILPAVRQFKVLPHKAFGLRKKDRHDPLKSKRTVAKAFGYVAQVLGLPLPELYVRPDRSEGLHYATTEPPASVVGQLLLTGFAPEELTFEISRHLAYYRNEHYIRWLEPTITGLQFLLWAAIKVVKPDFKTAADSSDELDQTIAALNETLVPTAREQLAVLVRKFIQAKGEADVKQWVNAVELTACRAGLLLCNDLRSAAKMIQNQPVLVGDTSAKGKIKELVLFSISDQYFRLRLALDVAIDVDSSA
jgi:tetratricopeptide (TPR) repeat protein